MRPFLHWLIFGNDDLHMPKAWLANVVRIKEYEHWTQAQRESYVTKDTAWFQRRDFWQAIESKPSKAPARVISADFSRGRR